MATSANGRNGLLKWVPKNKDKPLDRDNGALKSGGPAQTRLFTATPTFDFKAFLDQERDADNKAGVQHKAFAWLNWAPNIASPCYEALHRYFPGALPGQVVHARLRTVLEGPAYEFTPDNTLFGQSICPDEINNEKGDLADVLKEYWGEMFPLGGISGAPFVGVTGFSAFSHHVPDDGNILILMGPHVAISESGEVGQYLRFGQSHHSTACGAVIGAYKACVDSREEDLEFDEFDMQMAWIKAQIAPHVEAIKKHDNPMVALAYQAFEMVKSKLDNICNTNFGSGKLAIVGGIQINMPYPLDDHFLPLIFEVRSQGCATQNLLNELHETLPEVASQTGDVAANAEQLAPIKEKESAQVTEKDTSSPATPAEGAPQAKFDYSEEYQVVLNSPQQFAVYSWLSWAPQLNSPCFHALHRSFPGALPGQVVHARIRAALEDRYGFTPENTLFGLSICPDEINNEKGSLPDISREYWGEVFPLGGISGAPFVGKTGFKAFSHHVPDDGNVLVLFGPHVAISEAGDVGKYLRLGQQNESTACGAVIGAYHAATNSLGKEDEDEFDEADMQMAWIKNQLAPHVATIAKQQIPMGALAHQAFEMVKAKINKVVNNDFGSGYLALVGGIQINVPTPCLDHFLPLTFEVRRRGEVTQNVFNAFTFDG